MQRPTTEPTVNDRGDECHPSYGVLMVSRPRSHPPEHLFDSDIGHAEYVSLRVEGASRRRDLKTDWIHGDGHAVVEVEMSLAQWGAAVSSFGQGGGVPVTIRATESDPWVPRAPHEPRLALSIAEVRASADEALADIVSATEAVVAAFDAKAGRKEMGAALHGLTTVLGNAPSNMRFAATQLAKHAENVVTKAQADIEGMVLRSAQAMGLEAGDVAHVVPELTSGAIDAEVVGP